MIQGPSDKGIGRTDLYRTSVNRTAAVQPAAVGNAPVAAVKTPAAEMAALGAPVDEAKIAAIKAAIAEGHYAIDSKRIVEAMIGFERGGAA